MWVKTKSGRRLKMPTAAEEKAINAGIARDPDTYVPSDEEFKRMRPVLRGRPISAVHKVAVKIRLDPEIVAFFRESGRGWQTRINDTLRAHVRRRATRG